MTHARACGCRVVLTAGDPGVVARHGAGMARLMQEELVDALFCNMQVRRGGFGPGNVTYKKYIYVLLIDLLEVLGFWAALIALTR